MAADLRCCNASTETDTVTKMRPEQVPPFPVSGPTMVRCPACLHYTKVTLYHDAPYGCRATVPQIKVPHMHWTCPDCSYEMLTKTAIDSGRDPARQ